MNTIYKYFVLIACVFVVACSNEKVPAQEGELSEDNVFKGYVDTLDKAKGVEQIIQDTAQRQKEIIEKQEY